MTSSVPFELLTDNEYTIIVFICFNRAFFRLTSLHSLSMGKRLSSKSFKVITDHPLHDVCINLESTASDVNAAFI